MAHPLLPLLILILVLGIGGLLAYAIYTVATDVADKTARKMEKKNVTFSREGMKVGVREVRDENYVARTQNVLVKAWNYSTWPAYKSRLWNKEQNGSEDAKTR